jgi:Ni/Co efflux regulator RcnB
MRKLATIAAAALTLSTLALATPSFAAGNDNERYSSNERQHYDNDDHYRGDRDRGDGYRGDRGHNDRFDFDRHERGFDRWERGWNDRGYNEYRHNRPLSYWQLTRRLNAQGYYGVRGLRKSHYGFGWRAFAYTGRGRPVMLRINPYNGRVLNVRYV